MESEALVLGQSIGAVESVVHVLLFRVDPSNFFLEVESACLGGALAIGFVHVFVSEEPQIVHTKNKEA